MKKLAFLILWPAFLVAILAEGCFFSLFDPGELHLDGHPLELSARAAYTLGFLGFWLLGALASSLTCYLLRTPDRDTPF